MWYRNSLGKQNTQPNQTVNSPDPYIHPPHSAHNKLQASSDTVLIRLSSDTVCAHFLGKLSHDTMRSIGVGAADWRMGAEVKCKRNHHNGQTDN